MGYPVATIPKVMSRSIQDTPFVFSCTTVGAATLTLSVLSVFSAGRPITVSWGDGNTDIYTTSGAKTHAYSGAGTYTVKMGPRRSIMQFQCMDAKASFTINESNPLPVGLISLTLATVAALNWTVSNLAPLPKNLTYFAFTGVSGLVWDVNSFPMNPATTSFSVNGCANITWSITSACKLPSTIGTLILTNCPGITWTVSSDSPVPTAVTNLQFNIMANVTWSISASTPIPSLVQTFVALTSAGITFSSYPWTNNNVIRSIRVLNGEPECGSSQSGPAKADQGGTRCQSGKAKRT